MKKRLKINGVIMFCAFWLIVFFPAIFFRNKNPASFDTIAEMFGITFILLGQILRVSARGYKSEYSREGNALIQGGPYALVRNPMYLGILLIGLGIIIMLFQWWVTAIFLLIFIIRYILLIYREEKKLTRAFPGEYPAYKQRVPRLIPSITAISRADIAEYLPIKLSWLKKEIGTILAVLFVALFIESWEDIKEKGMSVYFRESIAYFVIIALFVCVVIYLSKRQAEPEENVSVKGKNTL